MPRRSKLQIEKDRAETAKLYLQGWLQAEIAAKQGVTQQAISDDLKAIRANWLQSSLRDFDEARAQELAKIDNLELTYWQAWERSCENAETLVKKAKGVDDQGKPIPSEIQQTSKGQAGDPRFLAGVERCIERRCKILGLDAPTKQEITGADGGPIETKDVSLTDVQRRTAIAAMFGESTESA